MNPQQEIINILQWIGGACYLFNKVLLSLRERADQHQRTVSAQRLRVAAWIIYCIGLPFVVVMLALCRNWIAASVEASGAPSMLLGLVIAVKRSDGKPPLWLDRLAFICIPLGFAYSLYDFGGLNRLTQWLEIGLVVGFLVGTYQLARDRASGYLWYVLMHVSCAWLMWIQGVNGFAAQQIVSLVFIADALRTRIKRSRVTSSGSANTS